MDVRLRCVVHNKGLQFRHANNNVYGTWGTPMLHNWKLAKHCDKRCCTAASCSLLLQRKISAAGATSESLRNLVPVYHAKLAIQELIIRFHYTGAGCIRSTWSPYRNRRRNVPLWMLVFSSLSFEELRRGARVFSWVQPSELLWHGEIYGNVKRSMVIPLIERLNCCKQYNTRIRSKFA